MNKKKIKGYKPKRPTRPKSLFFLSSRITLDCGSKRALMSSRGSLDEVERELAAKQSKRKERKRKQGSRPASPASPATQQALSSRDALD